MKDKLQAIREEALKQIRESNRLDKLNEVRVSFLGKKGELTAVLKGMKNVDPKERPFVGQMVNETREAIEEFLEETKKKLEEMERLQAENEYLRAENAVLKKLRELRLREEKEQEEKRKLSEDW